MPRDGHARTSSVPLRPSPSSSVVFLSPWPGRGTTADGQLAQPLAQLSWFGTLIVGKTDGSGLQYLRNRYYDPRTGRFTQEDPIGLAGGLNLYGFANGDPINFSDPFGLSADTTKKEPEVVKTSVELGASGSSLTVTNEYAPLTQEQADYIHDEIAYQEDLAGVAVGVGVALATKRWGWGRATTAGAGAGLLTAGGHAYNPRVGDQITTSVTAAYGSAASTQRFVVKRSDGSTLTYNYIPWGLR